MVRGGSGATMRGTTLELAASSEGPAGCFWLGRAALIV